MYNIYRFPIYVIVRTNILQLRDGHFWQFLIPIIDGGVAKGVCRWRGMAVMEIMKISEDCFENDFF